MSKIHAMYRWLIIVSATSLLLPPASAADEPLRLAVDGKTNYVIVKPENPSKVDEYAVETLARYLGEITGAEFPVVEPSGTPDDQHVIFVGGGAPMRERLGEQEPLSGLRDQEHVCRSQGENVFLYGKGVHGNLWAVMEFLEHFLGWRWFSAHEAPAIPKTPTIILKPFNRKRGFSFKHRETSLLLGWDFHLQNGVNTGYTRRKLLRGASLGGPLTSKLPVTCRYSTIFRYIPPSPRHHRADFFAWQDKKDYFECHPEFFTMNKNGKRVPDKQLCFGNEELRGTLTRKVFKHIDAMKAKGVGARDGGQNGLVISIQANDSPGEFCHCQACRKLVEKYQSPGGPLYECLVGLCGVLEKERPGVMVKTLAYRRSQTQKPPTLPEGEMLPRNLIIDFAPIEDNYFADWWNHRDPKVQATCRDLFQWGRITHHLWAWMYPNPFGTGVNMPVGNVERIVNNMRLMAYAGVEGIYLDHYGLLHRGACFAELQQYLILKLAKDVDRDADAVVKEFTERHYGGAAALMRTYIRELEEERKNMKLPDGVTYNSKYTDELTFPYLTAENIYRWQKYFDQMEELVADQPETLIRVQAVRRELDFATLWKWFSLKEKYPDYFNDYKLHAERIRAANAAVRNNRWVRPLDDGLRDLELKIMGGEKRAPLPERFQGVDEKRVRQLIPSIVERRMSYVKDPEAAFGFAAPVDKPDAPFNFGFYCSDQIQGSRPKRPSNALSTWEKVKDRDNLRRELKADEIKPGAYHVYELGEVELTPNAKIWFSNRSWGTHLRPGRQLHEPGAENKWQVYASMKFDGPAYGGEGEKDQVLVDRVILISKSDDQF